MSGYGYEVFLSYRQQPNHKLWLDEYFVPLFRDCLQQDVTDKCNRYPDDLFYYVDEIRTGMDFQSRLRDGIRRSRCLVALLSPMYFTSRWCLVEWDSFRTRGLELVVPVIIHDGASVRKAIGNTICDNFQDYTTHGSGFRKTEKYDTLTGMIRQLARRVAEVVEHPPPWKEFEVCDPPITPIAPDPKVSLQRLE